MEIDFKGKRALVTGAGKGVGRATVKRLVQCGAEVIALTRTQADLDTLVKEVPSVKPLCLDLNNIDEVVKAIEQQGDIHLLVNNAGFAKGGSFVDAKIDDCDNMMNLNFKAPLVLAQAVARKMIAGGYGGAIVNVSSMCSTVVWQDMGVYCCTKAALDMLTKVMALELGPHKIRANSVNPCVVGDTRGPKTLLEGQNMEAIVKQLISKIPLGRFAETKDIVDGILYLLSDKASMINGVNLVIDGGWSTS